MFVVGLYNKATNSPPPFLPEKKGNYVPNVGDRGGGCLKRGRGCLKRGGGESNL